MKRRNFLKWLISIPMVFISSRLPIKNKPLEDGFKHYNTISKRIDSEWFNNADSIGDCRRAMEDERWYHMANLPDKGFIITDSTDNIEEWLKS